MEADVATAWQTLEEAALTLGVSSRTLHRRISKGEFDSRMENGRREVLVTLAEPEVSVMSDTPVADVHPQQGSEVDDLPEDARQMVLALHEDRIRRTDLAIMAYQQSVNVTAGNARRAAVHSRIAWGTAGCLTMVLSVSAIWATHRVTRAQAEVEQLTTTVRQLSDTADNRAREVESLRGNAESAKLAAAKAEGELTAAKAQLQQLAEAQSKTIAETHALADAIRQSHATTQSAAPVPTTETSAH
jgi:hypothetical protein